MEQGKKTILIIEDSITEQQALKRMFLDQGFNVICAGSGEDGIEKAQSEKPDIVIIDKILPGIDGFETCKRMKAIDGLETKVIINTGKVADGDEERAREFGADGYSVKAADFKQLTHTVRTLLDSKDAG